MINLYEYIKRLKVFSHLDSQICTLPSYIPKRNFTPVKGFYYDTIGKQKLRVYARYVDRRRVEITVKNIDNFNQKYKILLKFGNNIRYKVLPNVQSEEYKFIIELDFDIEPIDVNEKTKIPKKIIQTYKTPQVSRKMYRAAMTIIDDNPEYEYYFYSDTDCRKYILKNCGKDILDLFDNLIPGAFKADLFRYCILSVEGGVYMDIDFESVVPLRETIQSYDIILVKDIPTFPFRKEYSGSIFQAFVATVPNHEMIKKTLEQCIHNLKNRFFGENPLDVTGPNMMGKTIMENFFPDKERLTIGEHPKYNMKLLWHKTDSIMDENNRKIIHTKFDGYDNSLDDYAEHYSNGGIYKDIAPLHRNRLNLSYVLIFLSIVIVIYILYFYRARK